MEAAIRILLLFAAALAACTPSPEEVAMPNRSTGARGPAAPSSDAARADQSAADPAPTTQRDRAAQGPIPEPVSAADNPLPPPRRTDTAAEAEGRRTLSTAFVMVGPDGLLTVALRDGAVLTLRNVVMRPNDYCGVRVTGSRTGAQYCGGYADVAAARPGATAPDPR